MKQALRAGAMLGISLLLAGCIQISDEYTLNPDGSGKVVHEAVLQSGMNFNLSDQSGESRDPAAQLTNAVQAELAQAKGVDAWKDVSFGHTDDGRIRFKATAYFPNLAKFSFHNGGFQGGFLIPTLKRDDQGGLVLELDSKKNNKPAAAPVAPPKDAAAEKAKIQEEKAQYQQMKPMMATMLGTMLLQLKFHLPGQLEQSNNFKRETPNTLSVTMDGQKFLGIIDSMATNDVWLLEQVRSGKNLQQDNPLADSLMNEKMYGEAGPVRATMKGPLQPLFNYAAEVAAAKQTYPAFLKASGLGATGSRITIAPATGDAPFKKLTIGGVRLIRAEDQKRGIRPFNDSVGYSISLIGELPGSVLEVTEGKLETATADTGDSLLPANEWDQKIHFLRLSEDKTTVTFEVKMSVPGPAVKAIKEVAGTIEYNVASGTRKVDLGMADFTAGATGKELGAKIVSIKEHPYKKGEQVLSLRLAVEHAMVKSIEFFGPDGTALKTQSAGSSWGGTVSTVEYSMPDQFPATGRIVVELNDKMSKHTIPFKLTNISLLGLPL